MAHLSLSVRTVARSKYENAMLPRAATADDEPHGPLVFEQGNEAPVSCESHLWAAEEPRGDPADQVIGVLATLVVVTVVVVVTLLMTSSFS